MRNKGKVHPSPSSSSSSSSHSSHHNNKDALSVLKLLPAAILAIAAVLSLEDREVLAYMITRSIKTTNPPALVDEKSKKNSKKSANTGAHLHKTTPLFDCECFDCYTSYWFRWDSSPNRELIHQAIEAFEEHLNNGEQSKKGKNKRRDKMGRRGTQKLVDFPLPEAGNGSPEIQESSSSVPQDEAFSAESSAGVLVPESGDTGEAAAAALIVVKEEEEDVVTETAPETAIIVRGAAPASNHKGLARKVLPDVLGLLNSRLWSLWSPNV
ncbi:unnamed protein product [Coffea canephora]|uniref:Uncharacterized protein n=1 Tax=Coffea canephora TaxID=49390 RepID=A0A068UXV3_COFCA|nr:unnamed protein product [Coffea canephora]